MKYDIVVYGATGFTGSLVAKYLSENAGESNIKWAIAGRNQDKLFRVKNSILAGRPRSENLDIILADNDNQESLERLAGMTRVVITTAGPYMKYGENIIKACVEAGTHCVDLSGEPPFVNNIYKNYNFPAERSGSIIINSCGFDSVPADLGAYYTAKQLGEGNDKVIKSYVSVKGSISGGTLLSAVEFLEQKSFVDSSDSQYRIGIHKFNLFHYQREIKKWALPMPVIDPEIVRRSSRLHPEIYGENFSYAQYVGLSKPLEAGGLVAGVGALIAASKIPFVKKRLINWRKSGEGPSEEERAQSRFKLVFIGKMDGKQVITSVSGGDPGYTETSKMISEAAMLLAENYEAYKGKGGVYSPAGILGQDFLDRLLHKGILFSRIS